MFKNKAIIIGAQGQDGRLLTELLFQKNYELKLVGKNQLDMSQRQIIDNLLLDFQPTEIYFLAAHQHSPQDTAEPDDELFKKSSDLHFQAVVNFLESMTHTRPKARFFYAATSHVFPVFDKIPQDENTRPDPKTIYAITKYFGMMACQYYRQTRGLFASCGILFNHESPLRTPNYLTRKVTMAVLQILQKKADSLVLGDLDITVDWGYAPEYVDAMHQILQVGHPTDYVISSGSLHTVRDFVKIAFEHVGLDYKKYTQTDKNILKRNNPVRFGNPKKIRIDTGWQAKISFEKMVTLLVDAELSR